jgi:ABC-type transporter Mla subunit MlaD
VHRLALAGTDTLGEGKRTIAAAQPLLASLTRTSDASTLAVEHFDALIQSPDLSAAISNVQETTQNVAGVTLDLRKVADKTTEDYLKPKTPWSRITHGLWNAYDLAAFTARHY